MYCAWCGTQVPAVSYDPCPRCGKPTNGALSPAVVTQGKSNTTLIIVIVLVVVVAGVLVIGGILAAIAVPNFLTAKQRAMQKRTMADLRMVATAVEAYATDKNSYPKVQSYEELGPVLTPEYCRSVPPTDGWGHPFRYACTKEEDGRCTGYVLGSAGKDGTFTQSDIRSYVEAPPGATTNFDCDIVFANGTFIEYPEGVQH